ncbi:MAG: hypothetical protein ACRC3Y_15530 [Romboutsia sp.]|uniref:hypothetical protein n=1 Tax=Romboutsia sp. TaxID=1965302 RepID=UPI003F3F39EF
MKRAVAALTVLCGGLLVINPVVNIFAQGPSSNHVIQEVQTIENSNNKETIKNEVIIKENKVQTKNEETKKVETEKEEIYIKEDVKVNNIEKEEIKENDVVEKDEVIVENNQPVIEETTKEEVTEENIVEVIDVLDQEEAKELLQMYKKDVEFAYQGDENAFEALAQKGLSGYVFLPDYDTDLGFFVDKNTSSIYYFHPSGYLELAL